MRALRLLLIPVALLLAAAPARAEVTLYEDSGATVSAIRDTVDDFRADLGTLDAAGGRREIGWDDVPPADTEPAFLPHDFYAPRGVVLSPTSARYQVSGNEFGSYNASYPAFFRPFSGQALFSPLESTVTVVDLVVPGSSATGLSRGFGAVFTNVDTPGHSRIELYDARGALLATHSVPAAVGDGTLSFLGFAFPEGRVASVRITSGDHPPDSGSTAPDVTVLDDLVYGEPVADGADADGVSLNDNCPDDANPDQANLDGDPDGDACDTDVDNDGVPNDEDAFPFDPKEWLDTDGDGVGDNADKDDDGDGLPDRREARLGTDPKRADTDGDGVLDPDDNCPRSQNADQADGNGNGRGDVCDDLVAPRVSRLRLRPKRFEAVAKRGTRVSYRLTEAARVRLTVRRIVAGHRAHGRCVRGAPGRHGRRCKRYAHVHGHINRSGTRGNNLVKFAGRLGTHTLSPGRYRLIGRPTDDAGNAGRRAHATFRILR